MLDIALPSPKGFQLLSLIFGKFWMAKVQNFPLRTKTFINYLSRTSN